MPSGSSVGSQSVADGVGPDSEGAATLGGFRGKPGPHGGGAAPAGRKPAIRNGSKKKVTKWLDVEPWHPF